MSSIVSNYLRSRGKFAKGVTEDVPDQRNAQCVIDARHEYTACVTSRGGGFFHQNRTWMCLPELTFSIPIFRPITHPSVYSLRYTYLPVSIMHICTGCLTGENPPNSAVLSCHLCLFYCPAKSQVTEIPLDDVYPLCPRSSTPSPPMGWFP